MSKGSCIAAEKRLGAALRMAQTEQLHFIPVFNHDKRMNE